MLLTGETPVYSPAAPRRPAGRLASLCGRTALAPDGCELGVVEDVIVDGGRAGGYLIVSADPTGDEPLMVIPLAAVVRETWEAVHVCCPAVVVLTAPRYDPRVPEAEFLALVSEHFRAGVTDRPGG